jgi:hypothetical protein
MSAENSSTVQENNDFILDEKSIKCNEDNCSWKKGHGVIYLVENPKNNKKYVGQADNFTSNRRKWGALGRWKSHIREAYGATKDHCRLLNSAIRKYNYTNLNVSVLGEYPKEELDEMEIHFIKEHNSLSPNGYNLKTGGSKGKDSEETKAKKKAAKTGIVFDEERKKNISKGQIGNRRDKKDRTVFNYSLPKYIYAKVTSSKITSFYIKDFPIGIEQAKYLDTIKFKVSDYKDTNDAYIAVNNKLKELEQQYSHIFQKVEENKIQLMESKKNDAVKKKGGQFHKNVERVVEDGKTIGFKTVNIKKADGTFYPEVEYCGVSSTDNKKSVLRRVKLLKIQTLNEIWMKEKHELPTYSYYKKHDTTGEITGFEVVCNNNDIRKKYGKPVATSFADPIYTMEFKYNCCLKFMELLTNGTITPENVEEYKKKKYELIEQEQVDSGEEN